MASSALKVILLEDDDGFAEVFGRLMQRRGHTVYRASTTAEFTQLLASINTCDLILMDLKLENDTSLLSIEYARTAYPDAKIFIITAFASIATTVEAIKLGADDYLPKPLTLDDVLNAYYGRQAGCESMEITMTPKRLEWEYIQKVLSGNCGNITKTANQLKMHRRTLQRKLNKKPDT